MINKINHQIDEFGEFAEIKKIYCDLCKLPFRHGRPFKAWQKSNSKNHTKVYRAHDCCIKTYSGFYIPDSREDFLNNLLEKHCDHCHDFLPNKDLDDFYDAARLWASSNLVRPRNPLPSDRAYDLYREMRDLGLKVFDLLSFEERAEIYPEITCDVIVDHDGIVHLDTCHDGHLAACVFDGIGILMSNRMIMMDSLPEWVTCENCKASNHYGFIRGHAIMGRHPCIDALGPHFQSDYDSRKNSISDRFRERYGFIECSFYGSRCIKRCDPPGDSSG